MLAAGHYPKQHGRAFPKSRSSNGVMQAFKADQSSSQLSMFANKSSDATHHISLLAATGTMSKTSTNRPRARSSPLTQVSFAVQEDAAASTVNGATLDRGPSSPQSLAPPEHVGSGPYTIMPRSMYTAMPPVKPEVDEQRRKRQLHSDAVCMAKSIYRQQQQEQLQQHEVSSDAANRAHGEFRSVPSRLGPSTLHGAAYKLAQERLSKIDGGNHKSKDYQNFSSAASHTRRRLGSRNVLRKGASGDSTAALRNRRQTKEVQHQMPTWDARLSQHEEHKRAQDRQALLAIAHKNVHVQLAGMDRKIAAKTGWVPLPTKMQWQAKVQATTRSRSDGNAGPDSGGQVDLGGGKYMDMGDVEAIASQRMRPELDKIYYKAEKDRNRVDLEKVEVKAKRTISEEKKTRDKERKEALKKQKCKSCSTRLSWIYRFQETKK